MPTPEQVWVSRNGQTFGPYPKQEARKLYLKGQLYKTDLACSDGANWHPLETIIGSKPGPIRKTIGCLALLGIGGFLILVLLIIGTRNVPRDVPRESQPTSSIRETTTHLDSTPQLQLQSWNWSIIRNFAVAEGEVKNISDKPLKSVMVVVTYKTESGEFITTGDAIIEFDPLMPGQTSPWKTMATANPAMSKASPTFKKLMGGTIPWENAKK
jgi:hypothetical protein